MSSLTTSSQTSERIASSNVDGRSTRNTTAMTVAIGDAPSHKSDDLPQRTLADVRQQVADELAIHAIAKAEIVDEVKIGVAMTLAKSDNEQFLRQVSSRIQHSLLLQQYLFAFATTASRTAPSENALVVCGSSHMIAQRALLLASAKFMDRLDSVHDDGERWTAVVKDMGLSFDIAQLWDIVRKAARKPMDALKPPPGSRGIDEILASARARLQRITPVQAFEELQDPAFPFPVLLVDIRPAAQRAQMGEVQNALIIERNVLEWRFDPRCEARLPIADRYDLRVIIMCQEGYTSSLAAASLQDLGLLNATDIIGGYAAWKAAGLPAVINPPLSLRDSSSLLRSLNSI